MMKITLRCCLWTVVVLAALSHVGSEISDSPASISFKLAHSSFFIHSSSFSAAHHTYADHVKDAVEISAAFSASFSDEEQELSNYIFHKTKYALHGSRAASYSSASLSLRSLVAKQEDRQFFVHFSVRSNVRTLVALQKFTGQRVIAHVEGDLYVAIGGKHFAAKARRFPGVSWVQEREPSSKLGGAIQEVLKEAAPTLQNRVIQIVAQCWYDGCGAAAVAVSSTCPDVYVHPTVVEVHCHVHSLAAAVSVLSGHVGVDHVEIKASPELLNFGGRAIIGTGPSASTPEASRVLSDINVSNSIIAIADSGIDMNNCFFYDDSSALPWNNSRVVKSYTVQPCEQCGRCCNSGSPQGCQNSVNACGNFVDQSAHGTSVSGTVAGAGPDNVKYGNGIASGAKIFFQDIQNMLNNSQCFKANNCGDLSPPTDLLNLFQPAYDAGARVHTLTFSNVDFSAVDAFTSVNPTYLIVVAAGNRGNYMRLFSNLQECKNCLVVGASQQSDTLFRSMQPFDDSGSFCRIDGFYSDYTLRKSVNDSCCTNPLTCTSRCCHWASVLNVSLSCCADQPACIGSGTCSPYRSIRSATNVAPFSTIGPTRDGRFKPDLIAPGQDILSAATKEISGDGSFPNLIPNHCIVPSQTQTRSTEENDNRALGISSGTSMSAALMAGASEKIRQYFVQGYHPRGIPATGQSFEPKEALVRAVILASCQSVSSDSSWSVAKSYYGVESPLPLSPNLSPHSPNFFQGFGLPVLDHAVYMNGSTNGYRMYFTSERYSPSSNATAYSIFCDPAQAQIPLTIALVWTDPPGNMNSQKQLVNDIDLIVLVPDSTPSQIFGNMYAYADRLNTVERVVTRCPAVGVITAIVVPGDLKTSSQEWFLVANGPLKSEIFPTSLPTNFRGRPQSPVTQTQPCFSDRVLVARVNFKPSSVWPASCLSLDLITSFFSGLPIECQVKKIEFEASLAQSLGVPTQAIAIKASNSAGIYAHLLCTATVNSGQNAPSHPISYVSPLSVSVALQNVSKSTYDADRVLSAFDWSTLVVSELPRISFIFSTYSDGTCGDLKHVVFIDNVGCYPYMEEGVQYFLRAGFCQAVKYTTEIQAQLLYFSDSNCTQIASIYTMANSTECFEYDETWSDKYECFIETLSPAPPLPGTTIAFATTASPTAPGTTIASATTSSPTAPPSTKTPLPPAAASSSSSSVATSPGVIAGSVIGVLASF